MAFYFCAESQFHIKIHLLRLVELTLVALDAIVGLMKLLTRFDVFDAMPLRFVSLELDRALFAPCESEFDTDTVLRNAGRCGELDMGGVVEFELEVFVYD